MQLSYRFIILVFVFFGFLIVRNLKTHTYNLVGNKYEVLLEKYDISSLTYKNLISEQSQLLGSNRIIARAKKELAFQKFEEADTEVIDILQYDDNNKQFVFLDLLSTPLSAEVTR